MRKIPPPPNPKTWDFSSCPPDEVTACLYYECSREVPAEVEQVRAARPELNDSQLSRLGIKHAAYKFSEFPDHPWLALDKVDRKEFVDRILHPPVRKYLGYEGKDPNDALRINPGDVWEIIDLLKIQYEETQEPPWKKGVTVGFISQEDRSGSRVLLDLDWTQSDRKLKADFAKLLKRRRPEECKTKMGRNNHRDLLNGLAGLRLIEHFRASKTPNPPETTLKVWRESGAGCPYNEPRALRASIRRVKLFMQKEFVVGRAGEQEG